MSKNIKFFAIGILLTILYVSSYALINYAYVISFSNIVSTYSIDSSTGTLSKIAATKTGNYPTQISFDLTGQYAYVVNSKDNNIYQYSVNKTTGALSQVGKAVATGQNPKQIKFVLTMQGKQYAYVTNYNDGTISAYSVDSQSGSLKSIGTFKTSAYPYALTADPSGTYLYVANWNMQSNRLRNYTINPSNGKLTDITNGLGTYVGYVTFQIKFHPTGQFVYAVNRQENANIVPFAFNPANGELSAISPVINTNTPVAIAFNDNYAYVVGEDSNTISIYDVNQDSGKLSVVSKVATNGITPRAIAFDTSGKYAYVLNYATSSITSFTVNTNNGMLDFMNNLSTGSDRPLDIVIHPVFDN